MEQNRWQEICEKAGFRKICPYLEYVVPIGEVWEYPNGEGYYYELPSQDMNALYEYFAPRFWVFDLLLGDGIFFVAKVSHPNVGDGGIYHHCDEDPVKALTEAIYKAIIKEV